jgi:hypothetical protein
MVQIVKPSAKYSVYIAAVLERGGMLPTARVSGYLPPRSGCVEWIQALLITRVHCGQVGA